LPYSGLRIERQGAIAIVSLDRPAKRNALNEDIFTGLERYFSGVPSGVRAVVLRGEGEHFSAGLDLSELKELSAAQGMAHSIAGHRSFDRVQFGNVPVVAVLHGAVVGGGLELACAAHIRVAESSAFYALPEGQRGIFVGGGGSVRVPRIIGASRMADMMLTGRVYSAEEGQSIGLSHYLAAPGEGMKKGIELARAIAKNAPLTNFAIMHALPRIAEASQDHGMFMEAMISGIAQSDPEAKRRVQDFLEKRAPKVKRDG
jgi:enoyl-CoA hydratase/carnithine racemase